MFGRKVWLCLTQYLAVFTSLGVSGLILNLYLVELGYREDFLGIVGFATTAALSVAAFPAGALADRYGADRCLIAAPAGLALAAGLVALSAAPGTILAAMVVHGACQALVFVPTLPYLMAHAPVGDHPRAIAASYAVLSLGGVVGSALGGFVPALVAAGTVPTVGAYRLALLFGAAVAALGSLAMLAARDRPGASGPRVPDPGRSGAPAATPASVRPASRGSARSDLAAMALATGLLSLSTGLFGPFFNVYLHDRTGAATGTIGVVYALGAAVAVPASLAGPAIGRRAGAAGAVALFRLASVPVMLLPLLAGSLGVGAVAYVLRAALVGVAQPLDTALVLSRVPTELRARASALRNMSLDVGWALASLGAGGAIVRWGYEPVFAAAALGMLLGVLVHYAAFGPRRAS